MHNLLPLFLSSVNRRSHTSRTYAWSMLNRFCTVTARTLKPLQPKSVMLTARRYGRYCVSDLGAEYAKFVLNYSNVREGVHPVSSVCTGAIRARNESSAEDQRAHASNLSGVVTIVLRRQRF